MLKVIIIQDEASTRKLSVKMLDNQLVTLKVIAVLTNVEDGSIAIKQLNPHLVFSDFNLKNQEDSGLLKKLDDLEYEIVFSSQEKRIIASLGFPYLVYLRLPFNLKALKLHSKNLESGPGPSRTADALLYDDELEADSRKINDFGAKKQQSKIAIPTSKGLLFIEFEQIIRCQSSVNCTRFFLMNKKVILISKTLKDTEDLLREFGFCRVHNSHLINLKHVAELNKRTLTITLSDGFEVDVSKSRKDELFKRIREI